MFYYSIYPEWNNKPDMMFDYNTICECYKEPLLINREIKYNDYKINTNIYLYQRDKPFRYVASPYYKNTDLEKMTNISYTHFDEIVKSLIDEKPEMLKYFEYIKTFRVVFF